jgi:hypothetical protein
LHRVLEFDRAHLGLPLSRLALYARRETAEWTGAWSFGKGFIKLGQMTFAAESNRVAVADFVLIAGERCGVHPRVMPRRCKVNVTLSLPVQMLARSLRVSLPAGRASKESPVPKLFRRIAPIVESHEAPAPACWIRDIRTDANPRRA